MIIYQKSDSFATDYDPKCIRDEANGYVMFSFSYWNAIIKTFPANWEERWNDRKIAQGLARADMY